MKIAFDYQIFMSQSFGGISRYFMRLAEGLSSLNEDARIIAPLHQNRYLNEIPQKIVSGREFRKFPRKTGRLIAAANRVLCDRETKLLRPDIFHETYYSKKSIATHGAVRFLTVYDMINEKFSDHFPPNDITNEIKRAAVSRADHIIAISQSTKVDLCNLIDISPEKVSVVHLGFDSFSKPLPNEDGGPPQRPFLLYVGNRGGYKNFLGFMNAVASSSLLAKEFDIVAFGGGKFSTAEKKLISSLGFRNGAVQQIGGDDHVLGELYRTASAFVYPSLYEGFGLPPLEAMAHDCPVVTSNTSSMPEVVGDAGEYFDPGEIDDQAEAISKVVFSEKRQAELVKKGKERLDVFSWSRCARETRDVYKQII